MLVASGKMCFQLNMCFLSPVCVWENAFSKPCVIVEDIYNVCSKDVCFLRLVCLWENVFPVSLTEMGEDW